MSETWFVTTVEDGTNMSCPAVAMPSLDGEQELVFVKTDTLERAKKIANLPDLELKVKHYRIALIEVQRMLRRYRIIEARDYLRNVIGDKEVVGDE